MFSIFVKFCHYSLDQDAQVRSIVLDLHCRPLSQLVEYIYLYIFILYVYIFTPINSNHVRIKLVVVVTIHFKTPL